MTLFIARDAMQDVMGHSFIMNYGHLVFHTGRINIRKEELPRLHAYLRAVLVDIGVRHPLVNGIEDHVHILGEFPITKMVPDIVRQLKIGSTYWLRRTRAQYRRFTWQEGYGYFSVGASQYKKVAAYVLNQQQRHAKTTTAAEMEELASMCEALGLPHAEAPAPRLERGAFLR